MNNKIVRLLLVITGLGFCFLACDKKPTEPVPVTDYPVYINDVNRSKIFTYYPNSHKLDSVELPWRATEGITVSADSKRLYLASRNKITVIDSKSFDLILELPYSPDDWVGVSPDNKLAAVTNGGLHLLSTSDYSVVFQDTIPVIHSEFSSDSKTLYCARKGTNSVYKVDLADSTYPVTLNDAAGGLIYYVIPSIDETKLFFYVYYGMWTYGFEVYDVQLDSIIFRDVLVPGAGQIAITPDGRYAIYSNAGISATDPPPPGTFTIFDIQANEIHTQVSIIDYVQPPCYFCSPLSIAVTPDGRWLVALGGTQLAQFILYQYNLQNEKLVYYKDFGSVQLTNLTVQSIK